jgi:CBS domain-containing protein
MSVRTILRNKGDHVETVDPSITADEAAWIMRHFNIGALVVVEGEKVLGLLTRRDLANGLAEFGAELAGREVRSLMKRNFVSIAPSESAKRVMALMTLHRTTHIPVMDGDKLAGIVSIGDIVKDRLGDLELETNVLRDAYIAVH